MVKVETLNPVRSFKGRGTEYLAASVEGRPHLMEQEELLFRTLERHIVSTRLKEGFGNEKLDVDVFISFSLSVQNRRKSRVGYALEIWG